MVERSKERPGTALRKQFLQDQIAAYVDQHLTEKITLKTISGYCGVSVSTVTQLFQKKLNTTFHEYVTCRRMETAVALIRQGVPLEHVGKQVGYQDHSTFSRAVRQHTGASPREFRNRQNME